MKDNIPYFFLLFYAAWLASCSAPVPQNHDLDEQQVSAVAWMQLSDEYQAICRQTFNCARIALDLALEKQPVEQPAIIIDVDETILNNSDFQAFLITIPAGYSDLLWEEWARSQSAPAIPGALEFLSYAQRRGVEVFYITNRKQSISADTLNNMKSLGFPFSDPAHILPRFETQNKDQRRAKIAASHQVLLFLGDSLNDFPGNYYSRSSREQRAMLEEEQAFFGTQYFLLPNPVYGAWTEQLIEGRKGISPEEQARMRKAKLQVWQRH